MNATSEIMQSAASSLKSILPKGIGFALLVFEFHKPGISNYISNAQRADMITALRETADRLEKRQDFQTPSN